SESEQLLYFFPSINLILTTTTSTTVNYTLSLHDALPICCGGARGRQPAEISAGRAPLDGRDRTALRLAFGQQQRGGRRAQRRQPDRKSTRLNSSHVAISYAVFCLKKKKN